MSKKFIFVSFAVVLLALLSCESPQAPSSDGPSTPASAAPAAPQKLSATPGNAEASVTWTASAGATGYKVAYTSADPADWSNVTVVTVTSNATKLAGLTNGTTYQVAVRAFNGSGTSALTSPITVTPKDSVPASPDVTLVSVASEKATFRWNAAAGATGYRIHILAPNVALTDTAGVVLSASTLTYEATGLINGTTYHAVVFATNSGGDSPSSTPVAATPQADPPAIPAAPQGLSAAAGNAEASVTWAASPGATGYKVAYTSADPADWSKATIVSVTTNAVKLISLTNGTIYRVAVQAANTSGTSALSAPVSVKPVDAVPGSPEVTLDSVGSQKASFHWNAVDRATGYRVYVLLPGATLADTTGVALPASTLTYEATGLTNGVTYAIVVVATNSGGDSAPSSSIPASPVAPPPAAPVVAAQTLRSAEVTLSWSTVDTATSYLVYVVPPAVDIGTITPVSVTGTTYTAAGLPDGTPYSFVVKAVGPTGTSAASATVSQASASQVGVTGALTGTWTWSESRMTAEASPKAYTATLNLTFTGTGYVSQQTNHDYADHRPAVTVWAKGTLAYRSADSSAVLTQTHHSSDGQAWTSVSTPLTTVYRNLLVDGRWHPDSWVRVGSGTGLIGTWRTLALPSANDAQTFEMIEYEIPGSGNQATVRGYQVVGSGIPQVSVTKTDTFTWTGSTISFTDQGISYALSVVKDPWVDAGEAAAPARVFTQP